MQENPIVLDDEDNDDIELQNALLQVAQYEADEAFARELQQTQTKDYSPRKNQPAEETETSIPPPNAIQMSEDEALARSLQMEEDRKAAASADSDFEANVLTRAERRKRQQQRQQRHGDAPVIRAEVTLSDSQSNQEEAQEQDVVCIELSPKTSKSKHSLSSTAEDEHTPKKAQKLMPTENGTTSPAITATTGSANSRGKKRKRLTQNGVYVFSPQEKAQAQHTLLNSTSSVTEEETRLRQPPSQRRSDGRSSENDGTAEVPVATDDEDVIMLDAAPPPAISSARPYSSSRPVPMNPAHPAAQICNGTSNRALLSPIATSPVTNPTEATVPLPSPSRILRNSVAPVNNGVPSTTCTVLATHELGVGWIGELDARELHDRKHIIFLDLDNWTSFFQKLPQPLAAGTFVYCFLGGHTKWREPVGCRAFDNLRRTRNVYVHRRSGTTKNAADTALAVQTGRIDCLLPKHIPFTVISGDRGFEQLREEIQALDRVCHLVNPHTTDQDMFLTTLVSITDQ